MRFITFYSDNSCGRWKIERAANIKFYLVMFEMMMVVTTTVFTHTT